MSLQQSVSRKGGAGRQLKLGHLMEHPNKDLEVCKCLQTVLPEGSVSGHVGLVEKTQEGWEWPKKAAGLFPELTESLRELLITGEL